VLTFAFHADLVALVEGAYSEQQLADCGQDLGAIDRTTPDLEVDRDVLTDRFGPGQGLNEGRLGVDRLLPGLVAVIEIAQGLQAAGCRTGAERDHETAVFPYLPDTLQLVVGRDTALDECDIDLGCFIGGAGFQEMADVDQLCQSQQVLAGVQKCQLAAIARGKFVNGDTRSAHLRTPSR